MKLIILDRDGVINHDSDNYIRTVDQWVALPNSIQAIADLCGAGYQVAIATNQSGIGRGYYSLETLQAMHQKMSDLIATAGGSIAHIQYCPHLPSDHCTCRKPLPGMLQNIICHYPLITELWFVGDSLSDIHAAQAIDIPCALVKTGKGQHTLASNKLDNIPVFTDLASFCDHLLNPNQRSPS